VSFLVQRSDVGEFRRRYRWLVLAVIGAFLVMIGRLVQLQLVEGDIHRAQARKNIVRERHLATTRGMIRDAYGRVLAANLDERIVVADPHARYFGIELGERTLVPSGTPRLTPTTLDTWLSRAAVWLAQARASSATATST